ncbi:unnamed protein product [Gongylonema pulchrum]|uniref:Uncharacterized protein n=1 Tax=Gongylonema pulchrum TaxID=637853 RepID=A0A3P7P8F8_9BILA|nr:unnamed protein product [Gongylonema pulchrum]
MAQHMTSVSVVWHSMRFYEIISPNYSSKNTRFGVSFKVCEVLRIEKK